jgi:hypothetical protein
VRILPQRKEDEPPPAVSHLRDLIRHSRIGRWVVRHKNVAAAGAALFVVAKAARYFIGDLVLHPGASLHWIVGHALLVFAVCAAIFAVAFVCGRLGIEWLGGPDEEPSRLEPGPAWPDRPRNQHADTHTPRGF